MPLYVPAIGGSSSDPSVGTATLDFGSTPVLEASVFVAQPDITAAAKVTADFQGDEMGVGGSFNSQSDHILAGHSIKLICSEPDPHNGFTIHANSSFALWSGRFRVRWTSL